MGMGSQLLRCCLEDRIIYVERRAALIPCAPDVTFRLNFVPKIGRCEFAITNQLLRHSLTSPPAKPELNAVIPFQGTLIFSPT